MFRPDISHLGQGRVRKLTLRAHLVGSSCDGRIGPAPLAQPISRANQRTAWACPAGELLSRGHGFAPASFRAEAFGRIDVEGCELRQKAAGAVIENACAGHGGRPGRWVCFVRPRFSGARGGREIVAQFRVRQRDRCRRTTKSGNAALAASEQPAFVVATDRRN